MPHATARLASQVDGGHRFEREARTLVATLRATPIARDRRRVGGGLGFGRSWLQIRTYGNTTSGPRLLPLAPAYITPQVENARVLEHEARPILLTLRTAQLWP